MSLRSPWSVAYEAVEELRVHVQMEQAQNIADRLIERGQKQMPADPTEGQHRYLANCLYLAHRWDEAYKLCIELAENYPDSRYSVMFRGKQGCAAARLGIIEEAIKISEELKALKRPYLFGRNTYQRVRIASILAEKQEAVDLLHQAMREGLGFGIYVIQDQDLLPLKDFPPFQEFIKPKG